MTSAPILERVADGVGHLTLNRPSAINALNAEMIRELGAVLEAWRSDPDVAAVVLDGAGERGFCAGGDVRQLREHLLAGHGEDARDFFRAEYRVNAAIAEFPKPVVALMDGVTMGGGIGLGGHAAIRVVTERSRLAMPETRIGFTPDVGGSWLLAHAPGELGTYLALNAATMGASDAIAAGFADHIVPSERIPELTQALLERGGAGSLTDIVRSFDEAPARSELEAKREWIDSCYSADSVSGILHRLRELEASGATGIDDASDIAADARSAADELEALSPTALTVTLASVRRSRGLPNLRAALEQEIRLASWFLEQPDFVEGVRAQLVDKDRSPKWNPPTLAAVDPGVFERALAHPSPALW